MLRRADIETVLAEMQQLREQVGGEPSAEAKAAVLNLNELADRMTHTAPTDPLTLIDPEQNERTTAAAGGRRMIDATHAILLNRTEASPIETVKDGRVLGTALALTLEGRVNKRDERARLTFLFGGDGATAIISELVVLATRIDPVMAERLIAQVRAGLTRGVEPRGKG